jgi:aspartyl-tRNA(Asn)/glutamyl-tRNA(Gln) amidotransferase subunit A
VLQCYQQIMAMQAQTVAATVPFDVVVSPVAPVAAFPAEQPMPFLAPGKGMAHIGFTAPYNMSGQPAASVNAGFTADGRPIGVQLTARRFDDLGALRAAAWYERNRPTAAVPKWPDSREQATQGSGGPAQRLSGGRSPGTHASRRPSR